MAGTLKHAFVSAKTNTSDSSKVQPSNWNADHAFGGGAMGALLYRDTGASDGASWLPDVAAGSVLVSGGVGSAPAFSATPSLTDLTLTGVGKLADGTVSAPSLIIASDSTRGFYKGGAGLFVYTNGTNGIAAFTTDQTGRGGVQLAAPAALGWSSNNSVAAAGSDVFLFRDAAAVLAQRNSTTAQTFRIYNTFTDASNYERAEITWSSNILKVGAFNAGTGSGRVLQFVGENTTMLEVKSTGFGYPSGRGGTVTQLTSKATGVTLSKVCGQITLNAAALAADTTVSFVLTNTAVAATDLLILNHISGGTVGSYLLEAQAAAGSATIVVRNITPGSLSEAIVISFAVLKAVTA